MGRIEFIEDKDLDNRSLEIHDLLRIYLQNRMNETENELMPLLHNILDGGSGESDSEHLKRIELQAISDTYMTVFITLTSIDLDRKGIK